MLSHVMVNSRVELSVGLAGDRWEQGTGPGHHAASALLHCLHIGSPVRLANTSPNNGPIDGAIRPERRSKRSFSSKRITFPQQKAEAPDSLGIVSARPGVRAPIR